MKDTGSIPDPQEIAHRLAIEDVLKRHCRGVDRADAAILKSAYWPDAEVDYGAYKGPAHVFCDTLPKAIRRYAATQHTLSNVIIDFNGDEALAESYMTAYHYVADATGTDSEMTHLGRYIDHMQRRGDVWKILFRWVILDWNQHTAATCKPLPDMSRGARAPDDPVNVMHRKLFGG